MTDALITKYRPQDWKGVIGQDEVVRSLKGALEKKQGRTFLLVGPSGTGKTTLARIAAAHAECQINNIQEIDAATFTGIDDMREITRSLNARPLGGGGRAIVLDECHRLSAAAWASLLKPLEEAPPWFYWFLCTTDPAKVPTNIQTRCVRYNLKPVSKAEITDLLIEIADEEGLPTSENIIALCAKEAQGSPRQAIANLAACAEAKSLDVARELLMSASDKGAAVDLAKALLANSTWLSILEILDSLRTENPESVRHVVRAYITAVVMSPKNAKQAPRLCAVLEQFSKPFPSSDGITPLVLACAALFFGEDGMS